MPTTNDVNKGALGAYCVYVRNKPNTTQLSYNAQAACHNNNTLEFMELLFTEEDYAFIRSEAQRLNSSGLEKKRKEDQAAFKKQAADMRRVKEALDCKKAEDRQNRLKAVAIVGLKDVRLLIVTKLGDQLDALKEIFSDSKIPLKSKRGNKESKQRHCINALAQHKDSFKANPNDLPPLEQLSKVNSASAPKYDELEEEMALDDKLILQFLITNA